MKRSPLARKSPLRSRPRRKPAAKTPQQLAWKTPSKGWCQCGNCWPQRWSLALERHHLVPASRIKQLGRLDMLWDQRNALPVDRRCHIRHTDAFERIPISSVPAHAFEFAVELMGDGPAENFWSTYYGPPKERAA